MVVYPQPLHILKIPNVPCNKREVVPQCSGCYNSIGELYFNLSPEFDGNICYLIGERYDVREAYELLRFLKALRSVAFPAEELYLGDDGDVKALPKDFLYLRELLLRNGVGEIID
ncbi:hypothetical protein A3L14_02305 [Thermococcus thioreducens]|uniref:Uncharacterized protein n=1 Tax=Thermococcus thioreducens TaxID=277988 RepID=A0A0Q2RDU1_9EURY|nr:hypothetical protein A3L14_02305 [Thermococcus thioreducens]KQH82126.1 hypothetical protein AMR53_07240 [Thermococcus thioreducens]